MSVYLFFTCNLVSFGELYNIFQDVHWHFYALK